jgi:hypothetical protein
VRSWADRSWGTQGLPVTKKAVAAPSITTEIYTVDGDFIKDIEINDLRNRYTLTKGAVQKEVIIHSLRSNH